MNSLVKIQSKGQMTIPRKLRSAVGVSDGDRVYPGDTRQSICASQGPKTQGLGQAVTAFAPAFSRQLQ
jgi:bifunctional DNA-binding transcriptional regulator/antitoxin component of YhaV-PrlF toxin-antitoxin module